MAFHQMPWAGAWGACGMKEAAPGPILTHAKGAWSGFPVWSLAKGLGLGWRRRMRFRSEVGQSALTRAGTAGAWREWMAQIGEEGQQQTWKQWGNWSVSKTWARKQSTFTSETRTESLGSQSLTFATLALELVLQTVWYLTENFSVRGISESELQTQCFLAQMIRFSNPSWGISFLIFLLANHLTDLSCFTHTHKGTHYTPQRS